MTGAWWLVLLAGCAQAPAKVDCPPAKEPEPIAPSAELLKKCDESHADACEEAYARLYIAGERDAARKYGRRTLALRITECGSALDCAYLPEGLTPLALNVAPPPGQAPLESNDEPKVELPVVQVMAVELAADGSVRVDGKKTDVATPAKINCPRAVRVVIKADRDVPYVRVVNAMDELRQAGCMNIAFGMAPGN
jgi:biopolymer transport protein ExbD